MFYQIERKELEELCNRLQLDFIGKIKLKAALRNIPVPQPRTATISSVGSQESNGLTSKEKHCVDSINGTIDLINGMQVLYQRYIAHDTKQYVERAKRMIEEKVASIIHALKAAQSKLIKSVLYILSLFVCDWLDSSTPIG